MEYLDFEIEIGKGRGRQYPVVVMHSPAGEALGTMRFPFDQLALENHLQALQIALLRSGSVGRSRRAIVSGDEAPVQKFGQALFEALFSEDLRSCFDVSRREAAARGTGLRLKLRVEAPELAALPWEYLFDPRQGEYLCFSRKTPLVRYLEVPLPSEALTVSPPVRVLGMIASPKDLDQLDTKREVQRLEESLGGIQKRGMVEVRWVQGETWRDLQREMRAGPWHIFHFIGHGGFDAAAGEGLIALSDDDGTAHRLRAQLLGRLLNDHDSLRLVVLNACEGAQSSTTDVFSSTAATLVRRGIPAVLAMQYEISDGAAIEFCRGFYSAVADGLPVDAAVAEARAGVSYAIEGTLEWGTPVLYMRSPTGKIFDMVAPVATGPAAPLIPVASAPVAGRGRRPPVPVLVGVAVIVLGVVLAALLHLGPFAATRPATISKALPPPTWALLGARPFDAFVNPRITGAWQGSRTLDNGALIWTVTSTTAAGNLDLALPMSESIDSDFHVVTEARQVNGPAAWYGTALRYKDNSNFYVAEVLESAQTFRFSIVVAGKWSNIMDARKFIPTPGKPNILSVRVEGSHFTFYVNDQLVGDADDARLTGGRTGVVVGAPTSTDERVYTLSKFQTYVPASP
jgi:hypothetical protein